MSIFLLEISNVNLVNICKALSLENALFIPLKLFQWHMENIVHED